MDRRAGPAVRSTGAGDTGSGGVAARTSILPMLIRIGTDALALCRNGAAVCIGTAGKVVGATVGAPLIFALSGDFGTLDDTTGARDNSSAFVSSGVRAVANVSTGVGAGVLAGTAASASAGCTDGTFADAADLSWCGVCIAVSETFVLFRLRPSGMVADVFLGDSEIFGSTTPADGLSPVALADALPECCCQLLASRAGTEKKSDAEAGLRGSLLALRSCRLAGIVGVIKESV